MGIMEKVSISRRKLLCGVAVAAITLPALKIITAIDTARGDDIAIRSEWFVLGDGEMQLFEWTDDESNMEWTTENLRYMVVMLPPSQMMSLTPSVPFPKWSLGK
jgi:hypothetical protein